MYFKEYVESYITEVAVEIDGKTYKSKKDAEADMKSKGYSNSKIKNKINHARIEKGKLTSTEQHKLARAAALSIGSDLLGHHIMSYKTSNDGGVTLYSSKGHYYRMPPGRKDIIEHPNNIPDLRVKNKIQKEIEDAHKRMVKKAKEEADKD